MSNRKFKRQFLMYVEKTWKADEYIEIATPMTVEFSIQRNTLASENTATFTIYNLSENNRDDIHKVSYEDVRPKISFFAGYEEMDGGALPRCFKGVVRKCFSQRNGSNWITVIEAYDGTWITSQYQVKMSLAAGTPLKAAIMKVGKELGGIENVIIGKAFSEAQKRPLALMGNPHDILMELTRDSFYIDSSNLYVLDEGEYLQGDLTIINSDNGLINTPIYEDMRVEVDMIFEPRIIPSQLITLEADMQDDFNGDYKVVGFHHRGIISDSMSGDCITTITMMDLLDGELIFSKEEFDYMVN